MLPSIHFIPTMRIVQNLSITRHPSTTNSTGHAFEREFRAVGVSSAGDRARSLAEPSAGENCIYELMLSADGFLTQIVWTLLAVPCAHTTPRLRWSRARSSGLAYWVAHMPPPIRSKPRDVSTGRSQASNRKTLPTCADPTGDCHQPKTADALARKVPAPVRAEATD